MSKQSPEPRQYKTEEELKREAKARKEQEARLEAARRPPSQLEKKLENFLYHYKYAMIAAVCAVAGLVFFLNDAVSAERPDLTLVAVSSTPMFQETLDALSAQLSPHTPDLNGDGDPVLQVNYIHFPLNPEEWENPLEEPSEGDAAQDEEESSALLFSAGAQTDYANMVKLVAVFSAGDDPLVLLDENTYRYLIRQTGAEAEDSETNSEPLFRSLEGITPGAEGDRLPIGQTLLSGLPQLEGLFFCYRALDPYEQEGSSPVTELLQGIAVAR